MSETSFSRKVFEDGGGLKLIAVVIEYCNTILEVDTTEKSSGKTGTQRYDTQGNLIGCGELMELHQKIEQIFLEMNLKRYS
ncbi:hypothetical protein [Gorillibacterium sp. sgz500922]|uniref:hypothetical protein n=1 Tax=Gorillibacterium sp. sgz500922 TaxID=3446694 RepID=UPI003F673DA6